MITLNGFCAAQRYHDIFPEPQASQLQHVYTLGNDARKLLVRLFGRKGEWFRVSKLKYGEIHSLEQAIDELTSAGLITQALPPVEIWLQRVTLAELKRLVCVKPLLGNLSSKAAISTAWLSREDSPLLLEQANSELNELWLQLNCQGLFELLLLLYFGNRYQDQSQFVVSELGLQRFEDYPLDASTQSFTSETELTTALQLVQLAKAWDGEVQNKQPLQPLTYLSQLPKAQTHTRLERWRQKLLLKFARIAERQQLLDEAIAAYQQCQLWSALERLCRCYESQLRDAIQAQQCFDAYHLAEQLQQSVNQLWQDSHNEAEALIAYRLAKRGLSLINKCHPSLAKTIPHFIALQQPFVTANAFAAEQTLRLSLTPASDMCVERLTADYFTERGYQAFFCENALLNGLFGLAFWDIIFAPVPGAFQHRYQSAPQDMYQDFYAARSGIIKQRLSDIAAGTLSSIRQHFTLKQGIQNDWVNWTVLTEELLEFALAAFSPQFLHAVFQRILKDPKHYRSGQPDLVLFGAQGEVRFVEVKGPGDSLSDHQGYWLQFLYKYYSAAVCIVNFNR